jgi:hypothetical protein
MRTNYIEALHFSVFHSSKGIFETTPIVESISFKRLIEIYCSKFVQDKTIELQKAIKEDKEGKEVRELKNHLPFYTTNGSFKERNNSSIVEHNDHLIALDIDGLTEAAAIEVKAILSKQPSTILASISPRLKGVKALIIIEGKLFASLRYCTLKDNKTKIAEALGINEYSNNIDKAQFVLSQPCFISFDESLYYNFNPTALSIELEIIEAKQTATNYSTPPPILNSRIETYLLNSTKKICEQLETTAEGNRHFSIKKISSVCSWLHYAPNIRMYVLESFYNSICVMYGGEKEAKRQGAIRAYNSASNPIDTANSTIESIINEIIAA